MTTSPILTFDVTEFRLLFPTFANPAVFPDVTLQMYWDTATCFISDWANFGSLQGKCRQLALNYMTAHLAALSVVIAGGQVPGLVQSATIDKVTVSLTPPPVPNQWKWWLNLTPYGQALLTLLSVRSAGGFYYGGVPELAAYRRVAGVFIPPS